MGIDFKENKGFRLLQLYERLSRGEVVRKAELAQKFVVTDKTIQRDIEELRAYLAETRTDAGEASIVYERNRGGYSVMENFFGLLKQEIYYGRVYHSYEELKVAIEEYIVYYNERRIKKSLGRMSPAEYRRKHASA